MEKRMEKFVPSPRPLSRNGGGGRQEPGNAFIPIKRPAAASLQKRSEDLSSSRVEDSAESEMASRSPRVLIT